MRHGNTENRDGCKKPLGQSAAQQYGGGYQSENFLRSTHLYAKRTLPEGVQPLHDNHSQRSGSMSQGYLFSDEMPMEEGEEWADLEGTSYAVSTHGRVLSYESATLLDTTPSSSDQYANVSIRGGTETVHRLVMEAFGESKPTEAHSYINHIDGDHSNNHIDNLEWVTPSENRCHGALMEMVERHPVSVVARRIKKWVPEVAEEMCSGQSRGRPRALGDEDLRLAVRWRRKDRTIQQIANYLGVSRKTVSKWLEEYVQERGITLTSMDQRKASFGDG